MTLVQNVVGKRFKLSFDNGKSYTFSKLKADATDDAIYSTATAVAGILASNTEDIYTMTDTEMYYEQ